MYESFFGFKEKPFNITPDPKYLYLSEKHQEAIAHLLYGIQERGGFVVVTGEIGTGKTTLCRYLLNELDGRTEGAVIFNPNLSEIELLKSINQDFGIVSIGQTKKELVDELNQFLLEERLRGKNMVLIIDEAQNLHPVVLEQVRMLSNLETEKEKLIQIILVGQPQLKKLLARQELRQLDQRVTARFHLNPLNQKETYHYIQHRLDIASGSGKVNFEPRALNLIFKVSKGIPRLINVICDRSLLGAFAAGHPSPIPRKVVKQAVFEVLGRRHSFGREISIEWITARVVSYALALVLTALAGWYALRTFSIQKTAVPPKENVVLLPDVSPVSEAPAFPNINLAEAAPVTNPGVPPGQAMPAEVVPKPDDQKMLEVLLSKDFHSSRLSAMKNLLALWGKHPQISANESRNFYSLAASQQMRCSELSTNFEGLRSSNYPCILEMFTPQDLNPRYLVLARVNGKNGEVFYGDETSFEVPIEVLDEFWMRRAFIFWKDFEQLSDALKPGDSGEQVVWLQEVLREMGMYQGNLNGQFDPATEEAILQFQKKMNLLLDGVVGPKTKLALYGNLKQYSMPRLNGKI